MDRLLVASSLAAALATAGLLVRPGPAAAQELAPPAVEESAGRAEARMDVAMAFDARRPVLAATPEGPSSPDRAPEGPGPLVAASLGAGFGGVRQSSTYPVPWVEATDWKGPDLSSGDFEVRSLDLESWDLFDGTISAVEPPSWANLPRSEELFRVDAPRETPLARKLKRLGRSKLHQEIRRHARKELRSQFKESAAMTYSFYRSRAVEINNIGREQDEIDDLYDETAEEVKEGVFRKNYRYGESEFPLLALGPLTIMDSGAMYFDLGRLKSVGADEEDTPITVGERRRSPFLADKNYRIDTSIKLGVNPGRAISQQDPLALITSYGVAVEVDLLSDVLGREMLSTELELEVDDGSSEISAFIGLVIKSRK